MKEYNYLVVDEFYPSSPTDFAIAIDYELGIRNVNKLDSVENVVTSLVDETVFKSIDTAVNEIIEEFTGGIYQIISTRLKVSDDKPLINKLKIRGIVNEWTVKNNECFDLLL